MKSKMNVREIENGYFFEFFRYGKWAGECKVQFEDDETVITETEWHSDIDWNAQQVYMDWAKRTAEMMEE